MDAQTHPGGFTEDWSHVRIYWADLFDQAGLVGEPDLHFLEIGCFEGMATRWLLDNVLTGYASQITVVDTFQGSPEFGPMGVDADNLLERFRANMGDDLDRVNICQGASREVLRGLWGEGVPRFQFAYVDGSHYAADVLADAVLAWDMLFPGGLLVFDDYKWGRGAPEWQTPGMAVDAFIACFRRELKIRWADYQVAVQKLASWEEPE